MAVGPLAEDPQAAKADPAKSNGTSMDSTSSDSAVFEFAAQAFHDYLLSPGGEEARSFLADHRIAGETIRRYRIGFAPDEWHFLAKLPGAPSTDALQAGDLVRLRRDGKGSFDTFRARIMVPHGDEGHVQGFTGRILPDYEYQQGSGPRRLESGTIKKADLLCGWEQASAAIAQHGVVYLVKTPMDTLAMASASRPYVLGIGRGLLSASQAARVAALPGRVVLAPDSDEAGRQSILGNAMELAGHGKEAYVAILQHGASAGDVLQTRGRDVLFHDTDSAPHVLEITPYLIEMMNHEAGGPSVNANKWAADYIGRFPESERERLLGFAPNPAGVQGRRGRPSVRSKDHGRVSDALIRAVREGVSLTEVAQHYTNLKHVGRSWKGRCPSHQEKTPSFHVREGKGFYCFGCGFKGGNAIDLVMQLDGATFVDAVRKLSEEYHISAPEAVASRPESDKTMSAPATEHTPESCYRYLASAQARSGVGGIKRDGGLLRGSALTTGFGRSGQHEIER